MPNLFRKRHVPVDERTSSGERDTGPLVSLFFRTSIKLQTTLDHCFVQFGMTAQEAAVLVHCAEGRETSAGRLAGVMGRDKGRITRIVDRLEANGFLTRGIDPRDHRLLAIKATSRGRRIAPQLRIIFEEIRKQFFEGILTNDLKRLGLILSQLHANARRLYENRVSGDIPKAKRSSA